MLPPANVVQVVCSRANSLIRSELRNRIAIQADLYVAMLLRRNTTCSREQMRYPLISAIRHRFVPALIVVLTAALFACICRFIIAALVKRRTAIADSGRIRISTIQSPVCPCLETARHCGEQNRIVWNLRFVADSFRLWPGGGCRPLIHAKLYYLQIVNDGTARNFAR
jgi:hypothetical protein